MDSRGLLERGGLGKNYLRIMYVQVCTVEEGVLKFLREKNCEFVDQIVFPTPQMTTPDKIKWKVTLALDMFYSSCEKIAY